MGYRSQVRCIIYGPSEALSAFITAETLIFSSPAFSTFAENLTRYKFETSKYNSDTKTYEVVELEALDLEGDGWKWYESYPDVQSWHKLMADSQESGNLAYEFVRIGEKEGDIERQSAGDIIDLLSVSTPSITDDITKGESIPIT